MYEVRAFGNSDARAAPGLGQGHLETVTQTNRTLKPQDNSDIVI